MIERSPLIACPSSYWPFPATPAIPKTSPARTWKPICLREGSSRSLSAHTSRNSRITSPRLRPVAGVRNKTSLPTISRANSRSSVSSGFRVATAVAPIGAVIGEWVGSSHGLGYLMLHANARVQIDMVFACLLILCAFSITQYFIVDRVLRAALPWQPDSLKPVR